jgi:hypothetical protein
MLSNLPQRTDYKPTTSSPLNPATSELLQRLRETTLASLNWSIPTILVYMSHEHEDTDSFPTLTRQPYKCHAAPSLDENQPKCPECGKTRSTYDRAVPKNGIEDQSSVVVIHLWAVGKPCIQESLVRYHGENL